MIKLNSILSARPLPATADRQINPRHPKLKPRATRILRNLLRMLDNNA